MLTAEAEAAEAYLVQSASSGPIPVHGPLATVLVDVAADQRLQDRLVDEKLQRLRLGTSIANHFPLADSTANQFQFGTSVPNQDDSHLEQTRPSAASHSRIGIYNKIAPRWV
jgi:hypothetical protein